MVDYKEIERLRGIAQSKKDVADAIEAWALRRALKMFGIDRREHQREYQRRRRSRAALADTREG